MDNTERKDIRLVVEDEKSLYSAFSPEDEFDEPVKSYIRSKLSDGGHRQRVDLTVMPRVTIDENRFRSAVTNWIRALGREERIIFFRDHKSEVLSLSDLDKVNGGASLRGGEGILNPGSVEMDFQGNFFSSMGYVCDGTVIC